MSLVKQSMLKAREATLAKVSVESQDQCGAIVCAVSASSIK
jgi:hypothetical protein